jgi:hypothetical protein
MFQCITLFLVFRLQIDIEFCILIEVVRCLASREMVILVTAVCVHFSFLQFYNFKYELPFIFLWRSVSGQNIAHILTVQSSTLFK